MAHVLTIGGATQDMFLIFHGADTMTITQKNAQKGYLLFQSGEKIEVNQLVNLTGGGATNAATSFRRLGFEVSTFCSIGNDPAGKLVLQDLEREQINTKLVHISHTHPTGTSFIMNATHGDRTIFVHRGANSHLELSFVPLDNLDSYDQLYITSLSNKSAAVLSSIVATAKRHHKKVAINPGMSQLAQGTLTLKESLPHIDTLILNSSEAHRFMIALVQNDETYKKALECGAQCVPCGFNLSTEQPYLMDTPMPYENLAFSLRNFFKMILTMGPKIVVVTNGQNGVYVATDNTTYFHPSIPTNVINTVGAGDAFGTCFVASLLQEQSVEDALHNGVVNSASVLSHLGAKHGLLTQAQLEKQAMLHTKNQIQSVPL